MENYKMKVFISHSYNDHDFALLLAEKLKKDSIDVWIDDWKLKVGDSIVQKINEGLENSSFLMIVFSEFSIKSDWVLRELNSTLMRQLTKKESKKEIKILPILLEVEPIELPPLFSDLYAVRFSRNSINETEYKKLIEPIMEKVKSNELSKYQDMYFENIAHVDMIIDKKHPTKHEVEFILKLIKEEHYRNYFFKKVTALHWFNILKENSYFNPSEESKPQEAEKEGLFSIPQWNVLPYLEKISQQVNIPGNEKYIDELLTIIREVSNYKDSSGQHIDNYRTSYYFVKILLNLPNEKISEEIINLIPIWLNSKFNTMLQGAEIATKLSPKFLTDYPDDIKKAEKIIDSITEIKTLPLGQERARILGKKKEAMLVVDSHWLKEAFDKHSETIGEKCSKTVIEDLTYKIKRLLEREEDGTYSSFNDKPEYSITDPLEMLTFILKRVLLAKAKGDVITAKEILKQFIEDKYLYFPKMAIYVIGQNMDKYRELFWEALDTEAGKRIMGKTLYLGDELKFLLRNLTNMSEVQIKKLDEKIKSATEKLVFKEDAELYKAVRRQEIYQALSHEPYFKNLYEEMKKITKGDAELHPAVGKVETRWGDGPSPLTKEDIIQMPNDKLAEFFATFKTKDSWRGPSVGGLAGIIGEVAKEMPEKFINDFELFKDTGFTYIYKILSGIRDAWNEKKKKLIIDWNKVFVFIKPYIDRKEFWDDIFLVEKDGWFGEANHQWIAGIVTDLIQDGTRNDEWAFSEEHFEIAQEIVFLLLDKLEVEESKEITDYVTYALNTAFGKALTAFILLALRIARVNDKKDIKSDIKWSFKFKEKYEEILNCKIIEGYNCLGRYLPNFYYLDKNWAKEKIESIGNEKGSKYWEAFVDGYLSIGKVYDDLYNLMKPHYQHGIEYDFKEKHDNEYLIQHISLAYLRGHESIDKVESLFKQILDKFEYDEIKEIIGFFWMQRGYLTAQDETSENMRKKIIEFWRWLYEKYKGEDEDSLTREDKQILSASSKLATFLAKIEPESFEWLMLSAPYTHEDFNSPFFIEYLDKLKEKGDKSETAKYIGDVYLKMLEKFTPDFDQKHIRSIVEFLYDAAPTDKAKTICNTYGSRGAEFLRDIYEKYSNEQIKPLVEEKKEEEIGVDELKLSDWALNYLKNENIKTIKELVQKLSKIKKTKNSDRNSLNEIEEKLAKMRLKVVNKIKKKQHEEKIVENKDKNNFRKGC